MDLRQGDALPCILFNTALEKVVINTEIDMSNKTVQILAYKDDTVLVWRTKGVPK
jgi:hypothetical protein